MGIVQTPCVTRSQKNLLLDARVQEFDSYNELVRSLSLVVNGDIVNNMDWVFQRTLTSTAPSATWPVEPDRQFYTPQTLVGLTKPLNSVEGDDSTNYLQPNFVYIMTDNPVYVTFGYTDDTEQFRDPTTPTNPLVPQPYNINYSFIVDGYHVQTMDRTNIHVAPATQTEFDTWGSFYSGELGGLAGPTNTWVEAEGKSDSGIIFPINVQKTSVVDQARVVIYAAVLTGI